MHRTITLLLAPAVIFAIGCSGHEAPDPMPSQTTTSVSPSLEPPPPLPPPVREVRPTSGTTTKVIDAGDPDEIPRTLLEASRYAKEKKAEQSEATIVITDDNLQDFTEGVEMMRMETEPTFPPPTLDGGEGESAEERLAKSDLFDETPPEDRGETYWRSRALELRMGWRRAKDRIEDLELEAAALRQEFYAQDDNFVRDTQIKPAWDRVLDRILLLEEKSEQYRRELDAFVAEGQTAGVPQGWLNAGWELGPSPGEGAETTDDETVDGFAIHRAEDPATTRPASGS